MGKTLCRHPGPFIRAKGAILNHLAAAASQDLQYHLQSFQIVLVYSYSRGKCCECQGGRSEKRRAPRALGSKDESAEFGTLLVSCHLSVVRCEQSIQ